jgi:hypothetical protein
MRNSITDCLISKELEELLVSNHKNRLMLLEMENILFSQLEANSK